jgi:uncharacterized protein YndB with AHSA1/START domain
VSREFTITRVLDASRERVWKAWTQAEHLKHWWGPKGFTVHTCTVDLRPGGIFHYGMRGPDGSDMWGRFTYREIVPAQKLVFIVSFSDPQGGLTRAPFSEDWPTETLSTVTFEEEGAKTRVTVRWLPHNATEVQRKTFDDGMQSMNLGWTGTFEQLTAYLAKEK